MMIMFIKVSQSLAISLLCLVGCSFNNTGVAKSGYIRLLGKKPNLQVMLTVASFGYWKETYKLEPGGSYSRERTVKITSGCTDQNLLNHITPLVNGLLMTDSVVIQFEDGDTVTLKVVSKYELIRSGRALIAFRRC
jgi:hypothetical protein